METYSEGSDGAGGGGGGGVDPPTPVVILSIDNSSKKKDMEGDKFVKQKSCIPTWEGKNSSQARAGDALVV